MMNISPMLAGYIENCSKVSASNADCKAFESKSNNIEKNSKDEFAPKDKKPKKKFAVITACIAAAVFSLAALQRGKKLNCALGEADDILSNFKAGVKTFSKKGREFYSQSLKKPKVEILDGTDNILPAINNIPYPPAGAEEITAVSVVRNPIYDVDREILLAPKADSSRCGRMMLSAEPLALVDHIEQARQNRIGVIKSYFGNSSIDFYKDRPMSLYGRIHSDIYNEIKSQGIQNGSIQADEKAIVELIDKAKRLEFDSGLIAFLESPDKSFGAGLFEKGANGTLQPHASTELFEAAKRLVGIVESSIKQTV